MLNKKIIVGVVVGLSTFAAASTVAASGAYFGGQLGYGNVHQKASDSFLAGTTVDTNKDTGVAGRLYGGYQVNDYFAAELGWTKFSNANVKSSAYGLTGEKTVKTNAVDVVAKGILPVTDTVSVYGKAGVAYLMSDREGKLTSGSKVIGKGSDNEKKLFPTVGAGVSYAFTPNVAADLSYSRIQKTGNVKHINSTDFVGVGLTYSFG